MNKYLENVKEFMITFGQPVLDKPIILPEDRQELRIALLFEELKEYAEASGKIEYFAKLCDDYYVKVHNNPNPDIQIIETINQVEQLDALLDLQYVLSGAVHEHGFGEVFDDGFDEVHSSNMSKVCENDEVSFRTQKNYKEQGIQTIIESLDNKSNGKSIIKRLSDMKVLKSINYKPAQLAQFLE